MINYIKDYNLINNFKIQKSNCYKLDKGYCYKIEDEISEIYNNKKLDIIYLIKKKKFNLESYNCIDCNSEIEITNINICNDDLSQEDIIEFNCYNCGIKGKKFKKNLKQYIDSMINHHLFNKCCICGVIQFDRKNKLFNYCIRCKKIFCEDKKCLLFHKCGNYFINLREKNYICLNDSHFKKYNGESNYTNYCEEKRKNLCDECYKEEGHPSHKNDKLILKYNNSKEEIDILLKIIELLRKREKRITDNKINEIEKKINNEIEKLELTFKKENEYYENNMKEELKKNDNEFIEIQKNEQKEFNRKIENELNKMNERMNSHIKNNSILFSDNDIKYNFEKVEDYSKGINNISNEYIYAINEIQKSYSSLIQKRKNEYSFKIKDIKSKFDEKIEKSKNNYNKKVQTYNDNFKKEKNKIYEELDDPIKNKIEYQILFIQAILNAYKFKENCNYYYTKNLFKLLLYFYNKEDTEIYKNLIENENIEKIKKMKNKIEYDDNNTNFIISNNLKYDKTNYNYNYNNEINNIKDLNIYKNVLIKQEPKEQIFSDNNNNNNCININEKDNNKINNNNMIISDNNSYNINKINNMEINNKKNNINCYNDIINKKLSFGNYQNDKDNTIFDNNNFNTTNFNVNKNHFTYDYDNKDINNINDDKVNIYNYSNNNTMPSEREIINKTHYNEDQILNNYSYELINNNKNDLEKEASVNDEDVTFELHIKNNSDIRWPPEGRTKIILDEKSDIKFTPFLLDGLYKDRCQNIKLQFNIKNCNPGKKKLFLYFNVDERNYGDPINLQININEDIVEKFRKEFNLSKKDYSDAQILRSLKKYKNDFNKTFASFFN